MSFYIPLLLTFAALVFVSPAQEAAAPPQVPGQRPDGSVLLPNQWLLRPAGRQVVLGDFPSTIALHPSGKWAAVLHCGYGPHEVAILDLATRSILARSPVEEAFGGLAFSGDGRQIIASGSGEEVVHLWDFASGDLINHRKIQVRDPKLRGIVAGVTFNSAGDTIFAANLWGQSLSRIDLRAVPPAVKDLMLGSGESKAPERPATTDDPSITKRANLLLEKASAEQPFPLNILLDEANGRLFVSLWAQKSVAVVDLKEWKVSARWSTEEHPNEMLLTKDGTRLLVANANRNSVSVIDTATGRTEELLIATLSPGVGGPATTPAGNTPNSLALSPDEKLLFVSNANINTVSVFDVSERTKARSLGFIPSGWYPTCLRVTPDGKQLLITNAKGVISRSNRNGPRPGWQPGTTLQEYIGGLFDGTLSVIDLPQGGAFGQQMEKWTAQALSCVPLPPAEDPAMVQGHPIPRKKGDASPIKYAIYILKENRTYDQVLGDLKKGNGDPSLCLFPEKITPNHHALAEEFVLLDNFYVEGEVSADGHEWSMAAYASDWVERNWPQSYGKDARGKFPYPSEGGFDHAARPHGGYIWDRAAEAGVSYRSYGEWTAYDQRTQLYKATVPALEGHVDEHFPTFDMDIPDAARADRFIAELQRFERENDMPRLQILRLPNDHTSGSSPGKPTPIAHVADNDLALGRVVEALSRSRFWPRMAIFVTEDDAQNGSDHVDAHRTIAYAISPYTKRRSVDSTLYSTSSLLRTIELILGLDPMSQFDAAAMPMFRTFQKEPDLTPYTCRELEVDRYEKNTAAAWGADTSLKMNFAKEDAADDLLLNEIIWKSVRGADSPMPPPRRAAFVFAEADEDDDLDELKKDGEPLPEASRK